MGIFNIIKTKTEIMGWDSFQLKQRAGVKKALKKANNKVHTLKDQGLTKEEAINKVLVEGYR